MDIEARNELVIENLDLPRKLANVFRSRATNDIDINDLRQCGMIGLIDAATRYIPGESSFRTYASTRVRGEILDECRRWYRRKLVFADPGTIEAIAGSIDSIEDNTDAETALQNLRLSIKCLNDEDQTFITKILTSNERKEVAAIYGVSESRISQKYRATLRKIKQHMSKQFYL